MGSPHYGFIVKLKKSPKAVGGFQAAAHLISVNNSLNFPEGRVYVRILGEDYKGSGFDRVPMGTGLERQRAKPPRSESSPALSDHAGWNFLAPRTGRGSGLNSLQSELL